MFFQDILETEWSQNGRVATDDIGPVVPINGEASVRHIFKAVAAIQAVFLASLGVGNSGNAGLTSGTGEKSSWDSAISRSNSGKVVQLGLPVPQGGRLADALDQIIEGEINTLHSSRAGFQVAQAIFGDFGGEGPY